jgi:hypothetical protein
VSKLIGPTLSIWVIKFSSTRWSEAVFTRIGSMFTGVKHFFSNIIKTTSMRTSPLSKRFARVWGALFQKKPQPNSVSHRLNYFGVVEYPENIYTKGESLVHQASEFILKRADSSKTAGVAAAAIPSLTSLEETRRLAAQVDIALSDYTLASVVKLGREAPIGFQPSTTQQTVLLARAALHFYIAADPNRSESAKWTSWWKKIAEATNQFHFENTEIHYLNHTAPEEWVSGSSLSPIHFAALLRRFVDYFHAETLWKIKAKETAKAFVSAATATLADHPSPRNVNMIFGGIQIITQRLKKRGTIDSFEFDLMARSGDPNIIGICQTHRPGPVSGQSALDMAYDVDLIWALYSECTEK